MTDMRVPWKTLILGKHSGQKPPSQKTPSHNSHLALKPFIDKRTPPQCLPQHIRPSFCHNPLLSPRNPLAVWALALHGLKWQFRFHCHSFILISGHSHLYRMAKGRRTVCTADDKLRYFIEPLQEEYSNMHDVCTAFDAAFAKLLWPLVITWFIADVM